MQMANSADRRQKIRSLSLLQTAIKTIECRAWFVLVARRARTYNNNDRQTYKNYNLMDFNAVLLKVSALFDRTASAAQRTLLLHLMYSTLLFDNAYLRAASLYFKMCKNKRNIDSATAAAL